MKLTLCLIGCLSLMVLGGGCAGFVQAPFAPPPGLLFTQVKAPLDVDYEQSTLGSKQGKAEATSILGLFSFGDCSIQAAARDGQLNKINHADYQVENVLGIFSKTTVVVYGE